MKKILLICLILFISGCTKVYTPIPMDLGKDPQLTSIKAITPIVSNGKNVTVDLLLTPGSKYSFCLLYTSPSPRDYAASRMPSSA